MARKRRKIKSLILILAVFTLLFVTGIVLKNIALHQIKKKVQSSLDYTDLRLSVFPPTLTLREARSLSISPFFSAKKIEVRISLKSLLTREKPLTVFIEHPILRLYSSTSKREKTERKGIQLSLPFSIQKALIKQGELYFWGEKDRYLAKGIDALIIQRGDQFSVKAETEETLIDNNLFGEELEGKASLWLDGRGKEVAVKKLVLLGPGAIIKAEGTLVDLFNPEIKLKAYFKLQMPLVAGFFKLPFFWEGKVEAEGTLTRKDKIIGFRGDTWSESIVLNRVSMGKVRGRIDFSNQGGGILELNALKRGLYPEFIKIQFNRNSIRGSARQLHLDPLMNYLKLPYPISSPVWGDFSFQEGNLRVEAEFRDELVERVPDKFPMNGPFRVNWNIAGESSFYSEDLLSSFARINLEGEAKFQESVDLRIQGEIQDLKQARRFTSLLLDKNFPFPEIRGEGQANLHIFGDFLNPRVESRFEFSQGGFDRFDAESVTGEATITDGRFFGRFDVDDPAVKGTMTVDASQEKVKGEIQVERGTVERIFAVLNIPLPFQGEAAGDFEFVQDKDMVQFKGTFSAASAAFENQQLQSVTGRIDWEPDALSLADLKFVLHEGQIEGDLFSRQSTQEFDIDMQVENVDLQSMNPYLEGTLSFNLEGKGVFGQDFASGQFEIKDLMIPPLQKTEMQGQVKASFTPEQLRLELEGNCLPGNNEINASLDIPFQQDFLSADIKGSFTNLNILLPWKGAEGLVNYRAEIKGPKRSPEIKGVIDFKGSVFPFPRFAQALQEYSGLIFVEDRKLSVRSVRAKLGGGDVQAYGELELGEGGVEVINLKMDGKNMLLAPLERTRALADGSLNMIKDANRFLLEGELSVQRLSWRREIYEKISFSSSPYYSTERPPGFFDDLTLNIRLRAADNAWIENALGRMRGRFDFTISGNVYVPVILGDIEIIEGNVFFQDRKFRILRGLLSFFNPSTIEPYLSFEGETYIKNYRVNFTLSGFLDKLNPELTSSPPLPPEDVLALLALGEAFKRTPSYDTTTQLSTASLLSFQLSEQAEKGAEKYFSLDRFRITPFVLGSSAEMTARLTIGKKIARDFSILYSTNLTTQREEITRLEWEFASDFTVVGTRDEEGRFSIDVKIHKRF